MMQLGGFTDSQLADGVRRRHQPALEELYRRHASSVAATSRMVLGNWSGCDDVVADVFLSFWLHPENFEPQRGGLLGYLRLKARGRSIDIVRSEVARRRREEHEARAERELPCELDEDLLRAEAVEQMRQALALLRDCEREPIELAFFTGMTYLDVAEHLQLPEGTVKARIRTGLHHLRVIVESQVQTLAESDATVPLMQFGRSRSGVEA